MTPESFRAALSDAARELQIVDRVLVCFFAARGFRLLHGPRHEARPGVAGLAKSLELALGLYSGSADDDRADLPDAPPARQPDEAFVPLLADAAQRLPLAVLEDLLERIGAERRSRLSRNDARRILVASLAKYARMADVNLAPGP